MRCGAVMSNFDEWRERYDIAYGAKFKNPPNYSRAELYFMKAAYNAGMERAAEIAESGHFVYQEEVPEAIRKEIEK